MVLGTKPEAGRIAAALRQRRARGETGLIAYLMAGDPDQEGFLAAARGALDAGADVLEVGFPFSDPLADGPVIQAAGQRALSSGLRVEQLWPALATLRGEYPEAGLAVMTYVNIVLGQGVARFVHLSAEAGADALIVPDLPPEESAEVRSACRREGLDWIAFVAPTATPTRMERALQGAGGFVYCVALTGVTGSRRGVDARLPGLIDTLRVQTELPIAVGFGVSDAASFTAVGQIADAAVVGSALVQLVAEGGGPEAIGSRVAAAVTALRRR